VRADPPATTILTTTGLTTTGLTTTGLTTTGTTTGNLAEERHHDRLLIC
jgi:hypothetical protein